MRVIWMGGWRKNLSVTFVEISVTPQFIAWQIWMARGKPLPLNLGPERNGERNCSEIAYVPVVQHEVDKLRYKL
jgi:hypothetical protein